MRYNTQQQALLKRAFGLVASALAASLVLSSSESVSDSVAAVRVGSTVPSMLTVVPVALPDGHAGDPAVTTLSVRLPAQDATHHVDVATILDLSLDLSKVTAGDFFAQLPYEQQQYQAVTHNTSQQPPAAAAQPTAAIMPPASATIERMTVGDWFSQINWQGSTTTAPDSDAQAFARMATSTALNTASRAVGSP